MRKKVEGIILPDFTIFIFTNLQQLKQYDTGIQIIIQIRSK